MSLTRLVMRIAAARAVRDKTLAGPRVFDSAVDPIDQTIAEHRQPLIVEPDRVYRSRFSSSFGGDVSRLVVFIEVPFCGLR